MRKQHSVPSIRNRARYLRNPGHSILPATRSVRKPEDLVVVREARRQARPDQGERYYLIQCLRFFAASFVVVYHPSPTWSPMAAAPRAPLLFGEPASRHPDLFAISGFVITSSISSARARFHLAPLSSGSRALARDRHCRRAEYRGARQLRVEPQHDLWPHAAPGARAPAHISGRRLCLLR